jgi:DNA repair protein RadD
MSAPLRDYQEKFIGGYHDHVAAGDRRILGVAPTAAGKTVLATEIVKQTVSAGERVLLLVHRRELIRQSSAKFYAANISHGIVAAGFPARPGEPVQVASIATLHARAMRTRQMELPAADLVIVDEAHHATAESWARIIGGYPRAIVLGLTATPCRKSGGGLGDIFETLIECPQVEALIAAGWLVPTRVYGPPDGPDLCGVNTRGGDYVENQLAERVDQPQLIGDVVAHWFKYAQGQRTIVFATSVAHSLHLRDAFNEAGALAEHLDGATEGGERDAILRRLENGTTDIVVNCAVLTEGYDLPAIGCIVLARPTKSFSLYRQMIGRGLRIAEGKDCCIVIDHAGATKLHGYVEEPVAWSLDTSKRAESKVKAAASGRFQQRQMRNCPECDALGWEGKPCRACGWRPMRKPEPVKVIDGDLVLRERGKPADPHEWSTDEKREFHAMLLGVAEERGWKAGSAFYKFQEKFGEKPPYSWRNDQPLRPTPEVERWIQSRCIAWRKGQTRSAGSLWQGP